MLGGYFVFDVLHNLTPTTTHLPRKKNTLETTVGADLVCETCDLASGELSHA